MARNSVTVALFFGLALVCCLQTTHAGTFDLGEYISERLQKTIKEENITCDNYVEFCNKSADQFKGDKDDVQQADTNEMAIELCKIILEVYVCLEENDIQKHN